LKLKNMNKSIAQPKVLAKWLWWLYGYTYDGLLDFYPYTNLVKEVVSAAGVQPNDRILDLGCGTGNCLVAVAGLTRNKVTGIDSSPTMLGRGRKKLANHLQLNHAELRNEDIVSFLKSRPDNDYDRIISINVLYALSNRPEIWRQLLRVLSPEGTVTIATPVKTGSGSLIKEQIAQRGIAHSVTIRLLGVFIIDSIINLLGTTRKLDFPSENVMRREIETAGGVMSSTRPCYANVNVLYNVRHK
jgi:ubiquinone/menaquinone biosynthesis C-methylase UbiE